MRRNLLRNIFIDDLRMQDKKLRNVEKQVEIIEKYFPDLKSRVSEYSSKKSSEKKCMDKISKLLSNYAQDERSSSIKFSVAEFSRVLGELNQHLQEFVTDLERNVIDDLAEFKPRSKNMRSDLKAAATTADQEKIRQRQLQRLELMRDQEHERISAAEADLLKAKAENGKATKALDEHAEIFEQKKLLGLRSVLLTWTTLELRYHARALELYTEAYRAAAEIDMQSDLEEFRNKMKTEEPLPRLSTVQKTNNQNKQHRTMIDSSKQWPQINVRSSDRFSAASSTFAE